MKSKGKILVKIRRNKQEDVQEPIEKSQYRQEVLKKIEQLEKEGKFARPSSPPLPRGL